MKDVITPPASCRVMVEPFEDTQGVQYVCVHLCAPDGSTFTSGYLTGIDAFHAAHEINRAAQIARCANAKREKAQVKQ